MADDGKSLAERGSADTAPESTTGVPNAAAAAAPMASTDRETVMTDDGVAPARTGTPTRHAANGSERVADGGGGGGGGGSSSRAASAHAEASFPLPSEAPLNGAPLRQYINGKVTGPLLEGMRLIAKEQPRDPLRVLGEYLLQRSRELEGTK